jgi:ubiquitin-conjugating enzyme E2 variant
VRGWLGRTVDALAVAGFSLCWFAVATNLVRGTPAWEVALLVSVALPAGHLVADLLTGLLHWFADEFFQEDTPLLGPALIHGFRDHHRNPRGILRHGLLEVSGYNALAVLPVLSALWLWPAASAAERAIHALVLACTLSIAATNQFHRFAHAERVPGPVAWLQRHGLVLSAEAHARHHRDGTGAYCVTAGWWNGILDASGILPAISRGVHSLTGVLRRAGRA